MRIAAVILGLFFFTSILAAQGTPTNPGSGQPETSSQTGTQPVSPLQEPPKADNSKDQRKQEASKFDLSGVTEGSDRELGEIRLMTRHTDVNGDPTRSFLVDGQNQLAEFNFFYDHSSTLFGGRRMQFESMYRGTDDRSIDPEHNSIQKVFFRVYGPRDEYIVGDTLVNFSRLTFNQNVKGVYGSWKLSDGWRLSTFAGIYIDRYGSLYLDILGKPYMSTVTGARVEHKVWGHSTVGVNFSSSDDRLDSLPAATLGVAPMPASNRIASIDSKMQFGKLALDGELAGSVTDFDTRGEGACALPCDTRQPQPGVGYQSGFGGRLEGSWRLRKLSLRGSFARYQPNFASMNARQVADLQDSVFRASYDLTDFMTVDGTYRRSNNDLSGQLPFETSLTGPEAHVTFHDLSLYRRAVFEIGYRQRNVNASDSSIRRRVRMPYAEFSLPYGTTSFTVGYERRQTIDQVDPTQTSNVDHPYIGLRGVYDWGGWHFSPTVRLELERQHNGVFPGPGAVGTSTQYLLANQYGSNRMNIIRLYMETPKWFIVQAQFRDASATLSSVDPVSGTRFIPSGYARPSYDASLTYKIRNDENTSLMFSFQRNNNYYFATPNFDERVIGVTFTYRFGKRASAQ